MKSAIRKNNYMLLVMLLFFLANVYAARCLYILKDCDGLIALYDLPGTIPASAAQQLEENEKSTASAPEQLEEKEKNNENAIFSQMVFWKSLKEVSVSAGRTGREQKVSCYQMKGQPGALFGKDLIRGRYFTEEESTVCLLDQDTVRQLFGSDDVLGMEIQVNKKPYQITGILRGKNPICVIPAVAAGSRRSTADSKTGADGSGSADVLQDDADSFDGAAVRKIKTGQSSDLVTSRLETVLGSTGGQKIDGHLYYVTAWLIYSGVSALMLAASGIAAGKRNHKKWISAVCLALASGMVWLGIRCADPGSDYLPAYWSDFVFFSRLFQEKAEQIRALAAHQEFSVWQDLLHVWRQAIGAEIFAGVLSAAVLSAACGRAGREP